MIEVCLVNPNALKSIYQGLSNGVSAIEPPIWAALLANNLRSNNISTEIVDCEGLQIDFDTAAKKIIDLNAKLICFVVYGQQPSASTQNMYGASLLCSKIKELAPDRKILFLGGHVSALPERTMIEEKCDFVAIGEGPQTIQGLLKTDFNEAYYDKVPSLLYRKDKHFFRSSVNATLIPQKDLATQLPGFAFDLLPMQNYRAHNWHCFDNLESRDSYASVYTSLGCPYKCNFCCISAPFGSNSFRYWEPEFMIQQFDVLANTYNVKNIKIADEMFVLNEKHYLKLCELLIERKYNFNIWAYARVDTVKPKNLEIMKKAGINWLALGIESKSKFVRNGVAKGQFKEEKIPQIVKAIQDAGINVIGNYIFGLPDETMESMQETLDLAMDLNCEMANFYTTMAYPGSDLFIQAIENKIPLPENWLGYSQHSKNCLPLATENLSAAQILKFRDEAWQTYFSSPKYLKLLGDKFGDNVVDHIRGIAKVQLSRDLYS